MTQFKTIGRDELKARLDRHDRIQLVNVLASKFGYLGSVPGSHRIPVDELRLRIGELNRSLEVVPYCAGPSCDASRRAAQILDSLGFRVTAFEGGIQEWKKAGYPLEGESSRPTKANSSLTESQIDAELEGSFPASDPPSWAAAPK